MADSERALALFIDFENLALGFQGRRGRFEIDRVIHRMLEKGKIVAKKAYADWNRYSNYTENLHEHGIELIQIPRRSQTGKNSADIRLCVDALDLAYSKDNIDTFAVISGDSDFSPLVSKLKENGKHVLGLGMQDSTSDLLRDNCDEFIYYEDLETLPEGDHALDPQIPEAQRKAFGLLLDALLALRRENKEMIYSSMVKDTMKRKRPSFNESYFGYKTFSALLEDAQKQGLIDLEVDGRSGTYVVTRFGDEPRRSRRPARRDDRREERSEGRGQGRSGRGPRRSSRSSSRGSGSRYESAPAAAAGPVEQDPEKEVDSDDSDGGPDDHGQFDYESVIREMAAQSPPKRRMEYVRKESPPPSRPPAPPPPVKAKEEPVRPAKPATEEQPKVVEPPKKEPETPPAPPPSIFGSGIFDE